LAQATYCSSQVVCKVSQNWYCAVALRSLSQVMSMRRFSLTVRVLGLFASVLFASQSVFHAINPDFVDFWSFCHWLGVVLMGLVVMGISLQLELSGTIYCEQWRMSSYFLNRLVLIIFYGWLGFFCMGSLTGYEWIILARVSGVTCWITAGANFTLAALVDGEDLGDEGEIVEQQKVSPRKNQAAERSPPKVHGHSYDHQTWAGSGNSSPHSYGGSHKIATPHHSWNTVGGSHKSGPPLQSGNSGHW